MQIWEILDNVEEMFPHNYYMHSDVPKYVSSITLCSVTVDFYKYKLNVTYNSLFLRKIVKMIPHMIDILLILYIFY